MLEKVYSQKSRDYFSEIRKDIVHFIRNEKNLVVLEVGAGTGSTLRHLKEKGIAKEVHLVDLIDLVEDKQDFDSVRILDIEKTPLDQSNSYDIIILADVLEHLSDPQKTIESLKPLLGVGGRFLVSLPNFRHHSAFRKIYLKGSFKYEEQGLFDRTHIRFFCKSDMLSLFETHQNLSIKSVKPSHFLLKRSMSSIINKITLGIFDQFLALQYLLEVERKF